MPSRPRSAAMPSARCCRANSATTWWPAIFPATAKPGRPSRTFACSRPPASAFRSRSSARSAWPTALRRSFARRTRVTSRITYSVRGRDLGSTVEEAIRKVTDKVKLPPQYRFEWAGEYQSQKRSEARLLLIVPLTVFLIFLIIYGAFGSAKWACLHLVNVAVARVGGLLALYVTGTHFSVSSGVGFPGSVRRFGSDRRDHGGVHQSVAGARPAHRKRQPSKEPSGRLRPIMMTMLVATLGLLPAALSHDIGSDSQRPFAIVIVGGLIVDLIMSIFLLPTFYVWWARPTDRLPSNGSTRLSASE